MTIVQKMLHSESPFSLPKMKTLRVIIISLTLIAGNLSLSAAENIQNASLQDGKELYLNGMGKVKQLSDSFYIGALYLEDAYRSVDNITYINNYKRMQIRIVSKRVSARRFGQYWKESISINNPRDVWEPQVRDVLQFTGFFRKTLKKGDIVNLDYLPEKGTYVYINDVLMGRVRNPTFNNLLMMTWLGNRPPNEQFKIGVMGGNDASTAVKLQQEFELLTPSEERIKISKSWLDEEAEEPEVKIAKTSKPKVSTKKKSTTKPKLVKTAATKKTIKKPVVKPVKKKVVTKKPETKKQTAQPKKIATDKTVQAAPIKTASNKEKTVKKKLVKKPVAAKLPTKKAVPEKKVEEVKVLSSSDKLKLYAARNSYERELRQSIRKYQIYPIKKMLRNRFYKKQMSKGQIESSGVLWVKIDRNGSVLSSKLEQSTGITILDKSAIDMVEKADPLPKMPKLLDGDTFEFLVQLKFLSPLLD